MGCGVSAEGQPQLEEAAVIHAQEQGAVGMEEVTAASGGEEGGHVSLKDKLRDMKEALQAGLISEAEHAAAKAAALESLITPGPFDGSSEPAPSPNTNGSDRPLGSGERCEARYNKGTPQSVERSFAWYAGTVKNARGPVGRVEYDVQYDDGVFEQGIPAEFVRREKGGNDVLPGLGGSNIAAPVPAPSSKAYGSNRPP